MASFEVQLNADADLTSATVAALSGRKLKIVEEDGAVHPFRSLATSVNRLSQALESFLNTLEVAEANGIHPTDKDMPVSNSFEALTYRAAEVFEVFEKLPSVIEALGSKKYRQEINRYRESVKAAARDWKLLCNALKHGSNSLAYTQCQPIGFFPVISGISLCAPRRGAMLDINKDYHQGAERVRSVNIELQHLIYSLVRCDFVAANMLKALPDEECEAQPSNSLILGIGTSLVRVLHRQEIVLPNQKSMFDGLTLNPPMLLLSRKQAKALRGRYTARTTYHGDGFTRTFPTV